MKKLLSILFVLIISASSVFAAKIPADVQAVLKKSVPDVDFRFDGVIILPDGTVYLPLYPVSFKKPEKLEIIKTYPENVPFNKTPDVVILNNDFVLLKVIKDENGRKTVRRFDKPPVVIRTGLLPQDMLVPKGLIIPENIKSIIGNLDIKLAPDQEIKVSPASNPSAKVPTECKSNTKRTNTSTISQLKDKNLYMVTAYSRNISVVNGESFKADYALSQGTTPVDAKITKDGKFLFVTSYDSAILNIISIADDRIIKQLDLTAQGGDILMDNEANKAYIATPSNSTLYVIDIKTMNVVQRIKINGWCEKLTIKDNYLLYVDKMTDTIWAIELANSYNLNNLGQFPCISKVIYNNGNIFLSSRTKNRIAVLDYNTKQLLTECPTVEKPVDMYVNGDLLYVLGAKNNEIQIIKISEMKPVSTIKIAGDGFATKFCPIPNTSLMLITDTKVGRYTIFDTKSNKILKTNGTELPINSILVGKKVKKIN